ncbi:mitochondrial fission 1 protein [Lethenteron reissneri]|uniref:mitochondrial fission 1 protein n=1 Tax=Lethenteron reissneri TaxID=7753 RepID=UPI002AB65355|nr:mitochondrial fission 1 protein [Lethenteron reissneri]
MEAILNDFISAEDLMKFEKKYNAEMAKGPLSPATQFEYAWCLVRSRHSEDVKRGVRLLEELCHNAKGDELRDYLFYISIGYYRLKDYEKALKFVKTLLRKEPTNQQALQLEKLINKAMQKDGLVGMAIVGGVVVGLAGLASLAALAIHKGTR